MTREAEPVDISQNPELLSFAREVKRSGTPRLLRADGEELVRVLPVRAVKRRLRGKRTSADDPIWRLVGIGQAGEPGDATSEHVDEFLAAFELESQE